MVTDSSSQIGEFGVHPLGCPALGSTLKREHQTPVESWNLETCSKQRKLLELIFAAGGRIRDSLRRLLQWVGGFASLVLAARLLVWTSLSPPSAIAGEQEEAKYAQTIEKRTGDILSVLELKDPAQSTRVHDAILGQYRALREWQAVNEVKLKELARQNDDRAKEQTAEIMSSRRVLHDKFLARLSADLSPEQVVKVKDKLTYNKLKVTYDGYCEIVPNLTEPQKAKIVELLKAARDEAMDGTSAEEKSAIFKTYKGKINNYLSYEGYDVGKAYKDWGARQKAKTSTATQPAK